MYTIGKLYDSVKMRMVIDGYNAPLTGGNFIDLVKNGFYNKKIVTRSDGFVVQMGDNDPNGEVHGYVPPGAKEERKVPLELSFKVSFYSIYYYILSYVIFNIFLYNYSPYKLFVSSYIINTYFIDLT